MISVPRNTVPAAPASVRGPGRPLLRLSLRARLILLVIAGGLPLLGFALLQQYQSYEADRAAAGERAMDVARGLTLLVERDIDKQIAVLEVLALSPTLQAGDLLDFRAEAEKVIAAQFPGSNLLLFEENGQQVMNLVLPPGSALPIRQTLDSLRQLFATGRPVVSNMFFGIVMRRPVVSIEVPVRRPDGSILYSLALNPPLTGFADILRQRQLPENWVASVVDGNGVIVARLPNPQQHIGQKVSASFLPHLMGSHEGIVVSKSLEGVPVLSAFTHAAAFGWAVGVGVPEASIFEPALHATMSTLAVGGALLLVGLVLAHLVARTISGPMATLGQLVGHRESEALTAPAPTGLPEIDEVMEAFHLAHEQRRQSERRVRELTAELVHTSRLSAMGQLSSSLAHELNQPLTAVMNYSEAARQMLNNPSGDTTRVSGLLEKAAAQAGRAGQIMRRLRSFVEKGTSELSLESLNHVVEEASALATTGTRLDGVEVIFELAANLPPVRIDKIQIQQVVVNLVRNAIEVLRDSRRRRLIVRTAALPDHGQQVSVIDSGPGIAPEIAAQLFKPFVTSKKDGMGIGLSISQTIVEAHGGRLWAEPNPDGGTIFRFTLPEQTEDPE